MSRMQEDTLIDLSPPSSGLSTPVPAAPSPAAAHAYNYGLGSAISGLWRRFSSGPDPSSSSSYSNNYYSSSPRHPSSPPPSGAHHNHHHHAMPGSSSVLPSAAAAAAWLAPGHGDGIHGAYTPPRRTASPLILPSLEPLRLEGYHPDTPPDERLLSHAIAEEVRTFLPERLKIGEEWRLVYSLYQHGSSLSTLYKLVDEYRGRRVGFVLVVRDGKEGTFGSYLTEAPHPAASYFGTGECFLWRASVHVPLPPPPSADTTDLLTGTRSTTIASPTTSGFPSTAANGHGAPQQHSIRFQNFAYTGANDYCIFCESKFLSVGGGQGANYGLWLDDSFSRGHSGPCDTFGNTPLSDEGVKFDVLGVELWVVGAS